MNKNRKTISKETQEAIKKFLTSNISLRHVSLSKCGVFDKTDKYDEIKSNVLFFQESPTTPTIGLDPNFSRILQKKREEQLEASRQKLYNSTASRCDSTIEQSHIEKKSESLESVPIKRNPVVELENSMMFGKVNKTWNDVSEDEDSFLALERQCNMEDKHERLINSNDTLLFDVEPPSELWDQTINQSLTIVNLDKTQDGDDTNGISPAMRIAMTRPSTIIEETSSQVDSSTKSANSSASTKSLFNDTGSTVETVKELSIKSCDTTKESHSSSQGNIISPFGQQNTRVKQTDRTRRGTFAFKRANYTFFPDENMMPINESTASETTTSKSFELVEEVKTPVQKLIDIDSNSAKYKDKTEDDEDPFNNTLERVDYFLEKRKQLVEETPVSKRSMHHNSLLETPIFSCKRKRLLSEMASEMLPLPKRGPLIDFSTPEVTNQSRPSKFARK